VLLEALEDFGGTLIFVSHDRYFVDKLATKVIEIGGGDAVVYPGNYEEFLWSKRQRSMADSRQPTPDVPKTKAKAASAVAPPAAGPGVAPKPATYDDKKKADAEARRLKKDSDARQRRISDLEARIAKAEAGIKELETTMSAPGFYENHVAAKPVIDRHQALMWEVGDLMNKWEALQAETEV
jgi:ATP-binding cassette subfamily F protein 3